MQPMTCLRVFLKSSLGEDEENEYMKIKPDLN